MAPSVVLGLATILTAGALLMVAISFATDHWTEYIVNRNSLREAVSRSSLPAATFNSRAYFYTRNRGLFRECFSVKPTANETAWLDIRHDLIDGNCLWVEYEMPAKEEHTEYGSDYNTMIQLRRCHFAFLICAMLLLLLGCFMGAAGCWYMQPNLLRITGIVVFFGAFFTAAAMAFFHGEEYLERERVPDEAYRNDADSLLKIQKDPIASHFRLVWKDEYNGEIERRSRYTYGWSYIIGWISLGLSSLAAIMYLCAAFSLIDAQREQEEEERRERKKKNPDDEKAMHPSRNRAYQYVEQTPDYMGYPAGAVPYSGYTVDPTYATGTSYPGYGYDYPTNQGYMY